MFGGYCTIDHVVCGSRIYQPGVILDRSTAALLAAASQIVEPRGCKRCWRKDRRSQHRSTAAADPNFAATAAIATHVARATDRIGRQGDRSTILRIAPHSAVAPPAVQPTPYVPPLPEYRDPPVFPPFIP